MFAKIKKNVLFLAANAGNYLLIFPFFRLSKQRFRRLPSIDSDICIEGFPRSGNSWFVTVFKHWNRKASLAHHSHLAGSIKFAISRNIPAVVLIRKPEDAVASALAWDGLLNVNVALISYLNFYHSLLVYLGHGNQLVVLKFEDVVQNPDLCIESINMRFSTTFRFESFTTVVDCSIRDRLKKVNFKNQRSHLNTSLPNIARNAKKTEYIELIAKNKYYAACSGLYLEFIKFAELSHSNVTGDN